MRIVDEVTLFDQSSDQHAIDKCEDDLELIRGAIASIRWPPGADSFAINPTREGNGVVPLREAFALGLRTVGWDLEVAPFGEGGPGPFDAGRPDAGGWSTFVEWETGNISSSHRSLNRLVLALMRGLVYQGVLVVSDAALYPFLTDRVGNWRELSLYLDVYRRVDIPGQMKALVVSYDTLDTTVPLIRKGTDGRALR